MTYTSNKRIPKFADAHYSVAHDNVFSTTNRLRVAHQLYSILTEFYKGGDLNSKFCFDIGCSTGIITNYFAQFFKLTTGIDVDPQAIAYARRTYKRKKIRFEIASSANLPFPSCCVDIVICNQTLAFVDNQKKTLKEIYRLLKPGGVCLLTIDNFLFPIESGYKLPFLHYLPHSLAGRILRLLGHTSYYLNDSRTFGELRNLCKNFLVHDYTLRVLRDPYKYKYVRLYKYNSIVKFIPQSLLSVLEFLVPSFVFLLEKPQGVKSLKLNTRRAG